MRTCLCLVSAVLALTACGGTPDAPVAPVAAGSTAAVDPAAAAAVEAAEDFLAAVVAEEYEVAYEALSAQARRGAPFEQFAAARAAKTASARSLGRRYMLTGATGTPPVLTVVGEGLLADGTEAAIRLPVRLVGDRWLVDAVPTAF